MRVARGALACLAWPLQPLRSRRLYLRGALVAAFLSVFASGTIASGGIGPAAVSAPGARSESPPLALAGAVVPQLPAAVEPPYSSTRPITPDAEFVRDTLNRRAPFVPTGALSEETLTAYALLAGWPSSLIPDVLDVAWCESRYDPLAVNGYMRGLMQVNTLWFDYSATDRDHWDDPIVNLRVARAVYLYDIARGNEPWAQWQCKPGGHVLAASAPSEPVSTLAPESPTPEASPPGAPAPHDTPSPGAGQPAAEPSATPSATPAPWDLKPSWPPKYDRAAGLPAPTP